MPIELATLCLVLAALSCGDASAGATIGEASDGVTIADIGHARSPIINGQLDEARDAVVAVIIANRSLCTGTLVHRDGGQGVVLTAAHCVFPRDASAPVAASSVVIKTGDSFGNGPDWSVTELAVHQYPVYDASLHDVAVLRVEGISGPEEAIPILPPEADTLAIGTTLTVVGYGTTSPGGTDNNRNRNFTTAQLQEIDQFRLRSVGDSGAACEGDSGGPALITLDGVEYVAGISSRGNCDERELYSARASRYLSELVMPFIAGTAPEPSCGSCQLAVSVPGGSCEAATVTCRENPACLDLAGCFDGCTDQSCINACVARHSAGAEDLAALRDCSCASCSAHCTGCESAGTGGSPGTGAAPGSGPVFFTGGDGAGGGAGRDAGAGATMAGGAGGAPAAGAPATGSAAEGGARDEGDAASAASASDSGGCSTSGRAPSPWTAALALFALGSALWRRRRGDRPSAQGRR